MNAKLLSQHLAQGGLDGRLCALYGADALPAARARYVQALNAFISLYGEGRETAIFSVPGRSELSGNHTDHNHGRVIAASVSLDIIAVASPTENGIIRLKSEGFDEDVIDLAQFTTPRKERFSKSDALIAGVCDGFRRAGLAVGGFDAYTTSNILKGSGLSSSAAFEDMIGNIENHLYNGGRVDGVSIAKIAQYAENRFFGKPCGLMDQMACALGGIISIDFKDPAAPTVTRPDFDLSKAGYSLCIVNTGGNHADLTPDYAAIPAEMKAVAAAMGKSVLREVREEDFAKAIPTLRAQLSDRAILRALHFFAENRRVDEQLTALEQGDLADFLALGDASGRSSFCYLQNVFSPRNPAEQSVSLALALAAPYVKAHGGACRVHGGGFAGTIQALVPHAAAKGLCTLLDGVLGQGACMILQIRPEGAIKVV